MPFSVKRVYDPPDPDDGLCVLVDRLWPRGVPKSGGAFDAWMPDVAPSTELRRWFGHDPTRWSLFRRRYAAELRRKPASSAMTRLRALGSGRRRVTLLFAAKDLRRNNAVVLLGLLDAHRPAARADRGGTLPAGKPTRCSRRGRESRRPRKSRR